MSPFSGALYVVTSRNGRAVRWKPKLAQPGLARTRFAARPCPATAAAGATRTVGAQRGTTNEEALRRLD